MPNFHPGWTDYDGVSPIDIHPGDRILFAIRNENHDMAVRSCEGWWTYELWMRFNRSYPSPKDYDLRAYKIMRKRT